jgi:NADH dehydrogenase/NADH:ubiquinone oxidoreductase subunit G
MGLVAIFFRIMSFDQDYSALPKNEVKTVMKQFLEGKGLQAERTLKNQFTAWRRDLQGDEVKGSRRTVKELWENAKKAEKIRLEREKNQRMLQESKRREEREAYLKNLANDFQKTWKSQILKVHGGAAAAMNHDADFVQLLATKKYNQRTESIFDALNVPLRFFNNRTFKVHGAEA